jgi:hypothetical protein
LQYKNPTRGNYSRYGAMAMYSKNTNNAGNSSAMGKGKQIVGKKD